MVALVHMSLSELAQDMDGKAGHSGFLGWKALIYGVTLYVRRACAYSGSTLSWMLGALA